MCGKRNCVPSFARNPMAVEPGIAGRTWTPVHRFNEQEQIPCLLPNVDLPVMGDGDFYSVYYSAGVLLEAEFMAVKLPAGMRRVVQVFRADDIGAAAAKSLMGHGKLFVRNPVALAKVVESRHPRYLRRLR